MYLHFYSLTTWYQKKIDIADASPQCIIPNFRHLMNEWMNEWIHDMNWWKCQWNYYIYIHTYIIGLDPCGPMTSLWPYLTGLCSVQLFYGWQSSFQILGFCILFLFFPNCKETFVTTESSCRYTIKEDHKSADFFFIFS